MAVDEATVQERLAQVFARQDFFEACKRRDAGAIVRILGAHGITVNCVAPGLTRTRFTEADLPEDAFEEVLARQALPRSLVPDDVAGVVAFLASDAAGAITGQTLCADGGSVFA